MQGRNAHLLTTSGFVLAALAGLVVSGCHFGSDDAAGEQAAWTTAALAHGNGPAFAQDSILIKFRDVPSAAALQNVLQRVSGKIQDANGDGKDDRFANIAGGRLAQVDLVGPMRAVQALTELSLHPALEYAEPNYIQYLDLTPNDSSFDQLWGLHNTGQTGGTAGADISAVAAWDITTGSMDVIVGVIDTGIDYTHPDLAANMWVNPGEIPGNGIDDDGNGYIDDVHGINAITNSGNPMDDHDHGTHVSGTIGAVGNNGAGVVGVNWNVSLVGMKFLSSGGSGTTADAIKCIDYAVALKNSGVDIRVLSNSWGGGGFSQALEDSIVAANNADILFLAAAGNSSVNNDSSPHYPSSYDVPNVVAVASTDHNDAMSSFSNWGATSVDLGAPGSAILSTTVGGGYASYSGTSMATPQVAGAAALLLSYNDTLTVAELKSILMDSGDPIPALSGKTVSGRRLNVDAALQQTDPPTPSFRLGVDPSKQTINQGMSTSFNVDVSSVLGFAGNVNLSVSSAPALNAATSFTSNPVAVGSSSTLVIHTTTTTAPGTYTLSITGVSGAITRTRTVSLVVRPEGTTDRTYTNTTVISIPDNNSTGITSTIDVTDLMVISEMAVTVDITHTYIGDLRVTLTSPIGTLATLHDRSGGSADDIHQTYTLSTFNSENAYGTWTLRVSDHAGVDVGTLDQWSMTITGVPGGAPGNIPPVAAFAVSTSGLTATFADASSDADGTIVSWSWDLGDGTTSTAQNLTHTYAANGTYGVSLTVVDDGGTSATVTQPVTVAAPYFTVSVSPATQTVSQGQSAVYTVDVAALEGFVGDVTLDLSSASALDADVEFVPNPVAAGGSATLTITTSAATELGNYTLTITGVSGALTHSATAILQVWPEGVSVNTYSNTNVVSIPDNNPTGITSTIDVPDSASILDLEVVVNITHTYIGDLRVTLTSPAGTQVILHNRSGGSADNIYRTYYPAEFDGEEANGTWTLHVSDNAGIDVGTLDSWSLVIAGSFTSPPIVLGVVSAQRQGWYYRIDLGWSGATGGSVDIYRNGAFLTTAANSGSYLDVVSVMVVDNSFRYVVCEQGSTTVCSNVATASF
jgi:serine protease